MARRYFVGTSGWHYNHWVGPFYPPGLPKSRWLEFYSGNFSTVELNNTFYRLPTEKAFEQWKAQSPEGFTFALKVSRLITHMKKMRNVEAQLLNFHSRARLLRDKLGFEARLRVSPCLLAHSASVCVAAAFQRGAVRFRYVRLYLSQRDHGGLLLSALPWAGRYIWQQLLQWGAPLPGGLAAFAARQDQRLLCLFQ